MNCSWRMANIISTGIKNFKTLSQSSAQRYRLTRDGMRENVFIMKQKKEPEMNTEVSILLTRRGAKMETFYSGIEGNER